MIATPGTTLFIGLSYQVIDLGVTRLLVQRLVRVFAHLCKSHYLLGGPLAVACRAGNHRISHMGRRSTAPVLAPGCVSVSFTAAVAAVVAASTPSPCYAPSLTLAAAAAAAAIRWQARQRQRRMLNAKR